jgi:hypothetical protein
MTTQFVEGHPAPRPEREARSLEVGRASSMAEALAAAGAIVLAILGLAGAMPRYMMTIGTIVLGAAILLQAGTAGARHHRLFQEAATEEGRVARAEVRGGMSAESIAGVTGIVLGILALLGVSTAVTLCAVALIAFGGGLLLGSGATARFRAVGWSRSEIPEVTKQVLHEVFSFSTGAEVLVGVGAIVLGILALLGVFPATLVLIGLLAVGFAGLVSSTSIGAPMMSSARHAH